jgi:hypothetical protein
MPFNFNEENKVFYLIFFVIFHCILVLLFFFCIFFHFYFSTVFIFISLSFLYLAVAVFFPSRMIFFLFFCSFTYLIAFCISNRLSNLHSMQSGCGQKRKKNKYSENCVHEYQFIKNLIKKIQTLTVGVQVSPHATKCFLIVLLNILETLSGNDYLKMFELKCHLNSRWRCWR